MVPNHLTVGNHTSPQSVGGTAHHLPLATLAGGAPQGRALLSSDNPATGGVSGTLSWLVRNRVTGTGLTAPPLAEAFEPASF
jgi:hypothetical protein